MLVINALINKEMFQLSGSDLIYFDSNYVEDT